MNAFGILTNNEDINQTIQMIFSTLTIERIIEFFLLLAAIALAYYTWKLVKQQKVMNEERAMPLIYVNDSDTGIIIDTESGTMNRYSGVWIEVFIRENIARDIHGKVYFEESQADEFRKPVAVPRNKKDPLLIHSTKIDSKSKIESNRLDNIEIGSVFTVRVELEYKSTLGGKYKSSHKLLLKKVDSHKVERLKSDMKYTEMPF